MRQEENSENRRLLKDGLVTADDLEKFRLQLVFEFRQIIKEFSGEPIKKWMKSREVMKLLDISPGTLQTLRNSKVVTFMKVGGAIYYDRDDIHTMFEKRKSNSK
ncbi:helix-turn-helix domain-containing protein [Pedobacter sp. ISL-68]|uniref:helix-turn-helix domain-containing protein n=1 Tax=unclassified Pedobacter TaxID=2628915 RepID=UPI001BECC5AF|nr:MULTISPECIES: helix-turn-helix domain-containing protein [unclassified Pedobacter]MBT2561286.1 helix-turn-helix domain-containing protein [Pedobacter sp. ISL-64]MBT2590675.1 helix-turn-helix domain-containing protein [Pedobacter sp. ISL-68]